jgi:iron-sulfur cluster repair protein YtfE (RIC family)
MPVITAGRPLREKLGDDGVDSLIELINQSRSEQKNDILEYVAEKFERRLSEEISGLKVDMLEKISTVEVKLEKTKAELLAEIAKAKAELIKWMFIFWIGQLGAILGILFTFFKK